MNLFAPAFPTLPQEDRDYFVGVPVSGVLSDMGITKRKFRKLDAIARATCTILKHFPTHATLCVKSWALLVLRIHCIQQQSLPVSSTSKLLSMMENRVQLE